VTAQASARSISRPVRERLHRSRAGQRRFEARVLAVFERACDLVTPDGEVVALVYPQVGDGPLNVVLDGAMGLFARVAPGAPVTLEAEPFLLRVSGVTIDLGRATTWEPRPDWDALRARRAAIASRTPFLRALCLRQAPAGSLLGMLVSSQGGSQGLTAGRRPAGSEHLQDVFTAARRGAEALRAGWDGDGERLQEGATGLAGLGSGLTPAGDDFLAGAMVWAWLAHPTPASLGRALVETAAPRTTTLSAALLRAAARGECSAPWHALLAALSAETHTDQEARIEAAARQILAHGATSGADTLAGFLYIHTTHDP
jgi:hypothetical protein